MKNETNTTRRRKAVKSKIEPSVEQGLPIEQVAAPSQRRDGGDYAAFIKKKAIIAESAGIKNPQAISEKLFPFQQACVRWALIKGRCALFQGTGLGKTVQGAEWARHVEDFTGKPILILAPLGVVHQTVRECKNILDLTVKYVEHQAHIADRGIYITNWSKMERFDPTVLGGVLGDETSIWKSMAGKTRKLFIDRFAVTPFRLACTATPAPNDFMELGSHCEALGVMRAVEMLSAFFTHDGSETQKWRLKGHGESAFWKWLASWSICITHPRDIGFEQEGYDLPPLNVHEHIVDCDATPLPGELFALPARTLQERRGARKMTIQDRVEFCADIIKQKDGEQWLAWCNLNAEAEGIARLAGMANITGSDPDDMKEAKMLRFASGELQKCATKPSLAGHGMNWQNCHNTAFIGLSDSWEQFFQAVRRFWRYGQKNPVDVHVIISSLEGAVLQNIKRKEADARRMQLELASHMAQITKGELTQTKRNQLEYKPKMKIELPKWL